MVEESGAAIRKRKVREELEKVEELEEKRLKDRGEQCEMGKEQIVKTKDRGEQCDMGKERIVRTTDRGEQCELEKGRMGQDQGPGWTVQTYGNRRCREGRAGTAVRHVRQEDPVSTWSNIM
jgi:hypothetical protein